LGITSPQYARGIVEPPVGPPVLAVPVELDPIDVVPLELPVVPICPPVEFTLELEPVVPAPLDVIPLEVVEVALEVASVEEVPPALAAVVTPLLLDPEPPPVVDPAVPLDALVFDVEAEATVEIELEAVEAATGPPQPAHSPPMIATNPAPRFDERIHPPINRP
jgi:hypothetical protein